MPSAGQVQGSSGKWNVAVFGPWYLIVSWGLRRVDDELQPRIITTVIEVYTRDQFWSNRGRTLSHGDTRESLSVVIPDMADKLGMRSLGTKSRMSRGLQETVLCFQIHIFI